VWVEMMRRGVGRFHALIIAMLLSRLTLGKVKRKNREIEIKRKRREREERRERKRRERRERRERMAI
jgi:hypothetical protein